MAAEPEDMLDGVDDKSLGLMPKYDVINRRTGQLVTEPVFVLKPDTDLVAREALRTYAVKAFEAGHKQLAGDIYEWLTRLDAKEIDAARERRQNSPDWAESLKRQIDIVASILNDEVPPNEYRDPVTDPAVKLTQVDLTLVKSDRARHMDNNQCAFCFDHIYYFRPMPQDPTEGWYHKVSNPHRDHPATPANLSSI